MYFYYLEKLRQKPAETVQVYAERMLNLGEDAFEGQDRNAAQGQLIGYFIDGLKEDSLKLKIMRENPDTFQAAVAIATREQNLRKRFQLRTGRGIETRSIDSEHEPMEVDHYRNKPTCFYCKKKGHIVRDCRSRKRDSESNIASVRHATAKYGVVCFNCGISGHFARECHKSRKKGNEALNAVPSHM